MTCCGFLCAAVHRSPGPVRASCGWHRIFCQFCLGSLCLASDLVNGFAQPSKAEPSSTRLQGFFQPEQSRRLSGSEEQEKSPFPGFSEVRSVGSFSLRTLQPSVRAGRQQRLEAEQGLGAGFQPVRGQIPATVTPSG